MNSHDEVRHAEERLLNATRALAVIQSRSAGLRDRIRELQMQLDAIHADQHVAENAARHAWEKLQEAQLRCLQRAPLGIEE